MSEFYACNSSAYYCNKFSNATGHILCLLFQTTNSISDYILFFVFNALSLHIKESKDICGSTECAQNMFDAISLR